MLLFHSVLTRCEILSYKRTHLLYCCNSFLNLIHLHQLLVREYHQVLPCLCRSRFDCGGKGDSSCPVFMELWDNKPEEVMLPSSSPTSPSWSPSSLWRTKQPLLWQRSVIQSTLKSWSGWQNFKLSRHNLRLITQRAEEWLTLRWSYCY